MRLYSIQVKLTLTFFFCKQRNLIEILLSFSATILSLAYKVCTLVITGYVTLIFSQREMSFLMCLYARSYPDKKRNFRFSKLQLPVFIFYWCDHITLTLLPTVAGWMHSGYFFNTINVSSGWTELKRYRLTKSSPSYPRGCRYYCCLQYDMCE